MERLGCQTAHLKWKRLRRKKKKKAEGTAGIGASLCFINKSLKLPHCVRRF
jgi:hypothetical protein